MILFPLRYLVAVLHGLWERLFNQAILLSYPPAMMRFKVSGTSSLLAYRILGEDTHRFLVALGVQGKVFDYGCGCGRVARYIEGCDGEDADRSAEWWCRDHSIIRLGVKDVDSVICISVLSHVDRAEAVRILNRIRSLLKPDGRLFVTTHLGRDYSFRRAKVFGSYFSTAKYSLDAFNALLDDCGFAVESRWRFKPSPSQVLYVARLK